MSSRKRSKAPSAKVAQETSDAVSAATDEAGTETQGAELREQPEPAADEAPVSIAPPVSAPTTREHLMRVLESLVFVSDQIITAQQLARITKAKSPEVRELLQELMQQYEGRGIELVEVGSGYQFRSAAASAPFVRDLVSQRPVRLTRAQLETLALVAYRQPITRPEIDDVRGVDSGSALKVLLERGLLKILGRKDEAGRPLLYGTTSYFLEFFGLRGMQDLPTLREFTDLSEEHRELFQRKMGEVPDLSAEAATPLAAQSGEEEVEIGDEELLAIAEAAKLSEAAELADARGSESQPEASDESARDLEAATSSQDEADARAENARIIDIADVRAQATELEDLD